MLQDKKPRGFAGVMGGRAGMALALLSLVAVALASVTSVWRERDERLAVMAHTAGIVADGLAARMRLQLASQAAVLEGLADRVQATNWDSPAAVGQLSQLLQHMADRQPDVDNIVYVDSEGRVLASAHPTSASRPDLAARADDSLALPASGRALVAARNGATILSVTRQAAAPGVSGVLAVDLKAAALIAVDHHLTTEDEAGEALLVAGDGGVIARSPPQAEGGRIDLTRLPEGTEDAVLLHDGDRDWIAAYRRMPDALGIVVRLSREEAEAGWRGDLRGDLWVMVPTIAVLALVFASLVAQRNRVAASEAAARASEARLRRITGALPGVVYQFRRKPDGSFEFPFISPQVRDVYGYTPEEVYRDPQVMFRSIVQDDLPRLLASIEAMREAPRPWLQQWRLSRNGAIRHLRGQAVPDRQPDGSNLWDGVIVDVTDLVAARDALRAERQLFVGGPVVVVKWDTGPGWPIDYVSPNIREQWGYDPDALLTDHRPFATLMHPDDMARVGHEVAQLSEAGRPCFEQEYRIRHADGRYRWVYDFTVVSRGTDGVITSYLGYLLDITERKQMERQIQGERDFVRTVVNSLPGVFYVIDGNGRFVQVNETMVEITGHAAGDLLAGGPPMLVRPEDRPVLAAAIAEVFRSGKSECEACLVTHDGQEVPYFFTGKRFDSSAGPRMVGMGLDVSAHKRLEETIRTSNAELESFAYIASHDLQEPLRTVTTFLQLLKREYGDSLPEEGTEYVNFAVDGARRMSQLIRDLLQYSRAGRTRVATDARCSLAEVFQSVVGLLASAIADSDAEVTAGALPVVHGDADQLIRLLQNLVGNALKYRDPARPPKVRVEAETSGGWVTLSISDNGIGIDPDYHDKIFQVFQRLHARDEYEGTGIGLAICGKIVAAHGGRIWVESRAGEGATFKVTLRAA